MQWNSTLLTTDFWPLSASRAMRYPSLVKRARAGADVHRVNPVPPKGGHGVDEEVLAAKCARLPKPTSSSIPPSRRLTSEPATSAGSFFWLARDDDPLVFALRGAGELVAFAAALQRTEIPWRS